MIKGIIFDLDGTLVNLPTNYEIIQDKLKNFFETDKIFSPLIPSIIKEANEDNSKIEKSFEIICEQEMIAIRNLNHKPGVKDLIKFLKEKDCIVCLVTMQCRKVAIKILNELEVTKFFSNILTRDENYNRLEQIQETLKKMKFKPDQTLIIADTKHDMECAIKTGCLHRLVTDNDNKRDFDSKTIKHLSEIKRLINN
jgi:HAD superfamily hydrolase (TIGR01549 family)